MNLSVLLPVAVDLVKMGIRLYSELLKQSQLNDEEKKKHYQELSDVFFKEVGPDNLPKI